jgi:hypothetical protein
VRFRIPWTSLIISVLVIASGGLAVQPVRDATTLSDAAEAYLVRPLGYVAMAPVSAVLDMLTLLSAEQHIAIVVGAMVVFAGVRALRLRAGWRAHLMASVLLVVGILAMYAVAALLPRPMAALVSDNANMVHVDFHTHTSASPDARRSASVERNRAWHRAAGYGVAYVADHASVAGAAQGMASNPSPAAAGVTLLPSIEVTWNAEHVGILGAERTYKGLLTPNLRDVDPQGLQLASLVPGREPVVIWHHPRQMNRLPITREPRSAGVRAIELVNGSPSDITGLRSKRAEIVALAERQNIPLVSGSDNHGWGRTAPAWTILRILDWRGMQSDALALQIEQALRQSGFRGTRVIERRVAHPGSMLELWLTVFIAPWRMLTTISNDERIVWLLWTWALWGATWAWRRRRMSSRVPQPSSRVPQPSSRT